MKTLLRSFIINLAALSITVSVIPGLTNQGGAKTLVIALFVLAIINLLIRPIVSLLLLPINLLTLGMFRWLVNVIMLAILTSIVKDIRVNEFPFQGFTYHGFVIPIVEFSRFWTLVLASLSLSITNAFLFWVARE
jgi:uncharacterized membrane protein YvlD (DUF360 family)